ncbi:helix-turn-helix domain-containing protein [Paenibacillus hamazuiensis]|uniref:helix-turn-helix domain-containing protein n=1 Tax=Paenibacillus hamazuiensis TaxID=2936508 RepID=UPI00200DD84D|nr:helix-turn-helix domain-containing protein [Paenibacillus hamazuiensis]
MAGEIKPIGLLNGKSGTAKFNLTLHPPAEHLAYFVEHYWIVQWDLRGEEPFFSENLPHPSVHLVFEKNNTRIVGVVTGKFGYLLEDRGAVFGIKFRPGAFYPFARIPVSRITDKSAKLEQFFEADGQELENKILSQPSPELMVKLAESFLSEKVPERDPAVELIGRIHQTIISDRELKRVEAVAARFQMTLRSLQRLFNQYVGVSPKWVIQRYRLHEIAERMAEEENLNWSELAAELGYHDQTHLIKAFKSIIGMAPEQYFQRKRQMT